MGFETVIIIVGAVIVLVLLGAGGAAMRRPPDNPNANNPDAFEADLDPEGDEPEGY